MSRSIRVCKQTLKAEQWVELGGDLVEVAEYAGDFMGAIAQGALNNLEQFKAEIETATTGLTETDKTAWIVRQLALGGKVNAVSVDLARTYAGTSLKLESIVPIAGGTKLVKMVQDVALSSSDGGHHHKDYWLQVLPSYYLYSEELDAVVPMVRKYPKGKSPKHSVQYQCGCVRVAQSYTLGNLWTATKEAKALELDEFTIAEALAGIRKVWAKEMVEIYALTEADFQERKAVEQHDNEVTVAKNIWKPEGDSFEEIKATKILADRASKLPGEFNL